MKVSIITTTYNSAETLEDCLQSIHSQTYPNIEHIIIDGGSKDGTLDIINRYKDNVRWISGTDKGIYDAMNKGISLATGDVIGLLNSDILKQKIEIWRAAKQNCINISPLFPAYKIANRIIQFSSRPNTTK